MNQIMLFIESDSKSGLVAEQLRNNNLHGRKFIYTPPIQELKTGNWICWFEADLISYMNMESHRERSNG